MPAPSIHRFERDGHRYAIDPQSCFCFECDDISWDVLEHFPEATAGRTIHLLKDKHDPRIIGEVLGELEWLRATKSILALPKRSEDSKEFEFEKGLRRVSVFLPKEIGTVQSSKRGWFGKPASVISSSARDCASAAFGLLINRSLAQGDLVFEFVERGEIVHAGLVAETSEAALRSAALAGKKLTVAIRIDSPSVDAPDALNGHTLSFRFEFNDRNDLTKRVRELAALRGKGLAAWSKASNGGIEGVTGRAIVRPGQADFVAAVEALDNAGFKQIELDLDGAFAATPELNPEAMIVALRKTAVYYANRLLENKYFRLDPIASLFWRIYEGKPQPRSDHSGIHDLAVDENGDIYPSALFLGQTPFRLGNVLEGVFDEEAARVYEDVGSVTMSPCRKCWARNLCGGGCAAVHYGLTGSIRTPDNRWCDAQRSWMEGAIAAFNLLSSRGVNFMRVYSAINQTSRPGLFTMLRAAMKMTVAMRPLEESDADMLVRWENWTKAAYFLHSERGLFTATKYDREMDSLHPTGIEQEMVLTRRDGTALGLARIRPDRVPGAVTMWLYFRNAEDYLSQEVQKGLKNLIEEALKQQDIRRVSVPVIETERALIDMLCAIGFEHEGTQRKALYLDRAYCDVVYYGRVLRRA
jgi:uncharacterized protein